ncbi:hypothetical protein BDB01DRAFT_830488 [Pilobolus umbonatus]|nr:hypothetical protein BDB01DRAFT_830488 [Pilobolus umbonatus]
MATDISNTHSPSNEVSEEIDNNYINEHIHKLRLSAEEERRNRQGYIEAERDELLKELFILTKEEDVMSFLKQEETLTEEDIINQQAFVDKHKYSNGAFPPLSYPRISLVEESPLINIKSESTVVDEIQTTNMVDSNSPSSPHTDHSTVRRSVVYLTTTLPRKSDANDHTVQIYNGHKFTDQRYDKSSDIDLYAWQLRATSQPLYKQLQQARKVLTTHDWTLARTELKSIKSISAIENLKKKNMWSLRQLKRHQATTRTKTHWDLLLDEMRWMRVDFKEERKWKMATAYMLSKAVMEWHAAEDKSSVCVQTRPTPSLMVKGEDVGEMTSPDMETTDSEMMVDKEEVLQSDIETPEGTSPDKDQTVKQETTGDEDGDEEVDEDEDEDEDEPDNPISSEIIEECRVLIQDLDPNNTIFTLDSPWEDDLVSLFPDLLLYTAPDPDSIGNDPYFDESDFAKTLPFRLSTQRIILKDPSNKSERSVNSKDVKPIHKHESLQASPLFTSKKSKDAPAPQPAIPPQPATIKQDSNWTEDDDLCLIQLIVQYSFNWDIICDILNSIRIPITGEKRTPWECHERWRQNNLTSLSGQVNAAYIPQLKKDLAKRPSPLKFDSARKRQRQYNIFEAIKKTQKKREEINKSKVNAAPPRTTIETHGMSTQGQRLPSAMELSIHKMQRERQITQALMEQRQMTANYGLTASVNNAAVPQLPVSVPQMRPHTAVTSTAASAAIAAAAAAAAVNRTIPSGGAANRPPTTPQLQLQIQQQLQQQQQQIVQQQVQQQQAQQAQQAQAQQVQQQQQQLQQQQQVQNLQAQLAANSTAGISANRYPAAQLHLLRQQQLALMAAAAAAQQQQQGQIRPTINNSMQQRFANVLANSQNQAISPVANADVDTVPQIGSPALQHAQQQNLLQQQSTANTLAIATQLAQLGYPIPSLAQFGPSQQANLQRYIAQLQIRTQQHQQQQQQQQQQQTTNIGSPQLVNSPVNNTTTNANNPGLSPSQQITVNNLTAAMLQQQQAQLQQRLQAAHIQQAIHLQQQLQQQQLQQQLQQQPQPQSQPPQANSSSPMLQPSPSQTPNNLNGQNINQ